MLISKSGGRAVSSVFKCTARSWEIRIQGEDGERQLPGFPRIDFLQIGTVKFSSKNNVSFISFLKALMQETPLLLLHI